MGAGLFKFVYFFLSDSELHVLSHATLHLFYRCIWETVDAPTTTTSTAFETSTAASLQTTLLMTTTSLTTSETTSLLTTTSTTITSTELLVTSTDVTNTTRPTTPMTTSTSKPMPLPLSRGSTLTPSTTSTKIVYNNPDLIYIPHSPSISHPNKSYDYYCCHHGGCNLTSNEKCCKIYGICKRNSVPTSTLRATTSDTTEKIIKQETEAPTTVSLKKITLASVMGGLFILFLVTCTILALCQCVQNRKREEKKKLSNQSMDTVTTVLETSV